MTWKHILFIGSVIALLSSCSTLDKAMHPSRYCIEKGCHKKRMPNSNYCQRHYMLKMEEIVRTAEKVKRESEAAEKANKGK